MVTNFVSVRNLIRLGTVFMVFSILFCYKTSQIHAQTTSLSIWPPLLETTIRPGQTITQTFRLKNLGDDTTITAQLKPFTPTDELGHVQLQLQGQSLMASSEPSSVLNFFSLTNQALPTTFPLKAGQTQELQLKISIPDIAKSKDHYLTFLFSSQTPGLISGTGTTTQAAIGSNILLTVSNANQPKPNAKIVEFRLGYELPEKFVTFPFPSLLDSFSPISFLLRVKNPTPHYLKTIGQIEIKNTFGKTTSTLPIRQDNILAGTTRQIQTDPFDSAFPFGRYTATATLTPENSTNSTTQTFIFYAIPYKLLLGFSLVILLFRRFSKRP